MRKLILTYLLFVASWSLQAQQFNKPLADSLFSALQAHDKYNGALCMKKMAKQFIKTVPAMLTLRQTSQ